MKSNWNRQGRRSGGYRPARFNAARLSADDLKVLAQEAEVRKQFGEEGVKRFWEEMASRSEESRHDA